jgi:hypothetical protein
VKNGRKKLNLLILTPLPILRPWVTTPAL